MVTSVCHIQCYEKYLLPQVVSFSRVPGVLTFVSGQGRQRENWEWVLIFFLPTLQRLNNTEVVLRLYGTLLPKEDLLQGQSEIHSVG